MSIIEQALRRVQDPVISGQVTSPQQPAAQADADQATVHSWQTEPGARLPTSNRMPHMTNALVLVALAVIGLTTVLVVGGAFWMGRALPPATATADSSSSAQQADEAASAMDPGSALAPASAAAFGTAKSARKSKETAYVLSGVVEGVGDPYAVINGEIAGIGDRIGEATLVGIASSTATLRLANGQDLIVRVAQ